MLISQFTDSYLLFHGLKSGNGHSETPVRVQICHSKRIRVHLQGRRLKEEKKPVPSSYFSSYLPTTITPRKPIRIKTSYCRNECQMIEETLQLYLYFRKKLITMKTSSLGKCTRKTRYIIPKNKRRIVRTVKLVGPRI